MPKLIVAMTRSGLVEENNEGEQQPVVAWGDWEYTMLISFYSSPEVEVLTEIPFPDELERHGLRMYRGENPDTE